MAAIAEIDLGFVFPIFFSDSSDLTLFELGDLDRAAALGRSDPRTENQLQDGSLAERVQNDLETTAFLYKEAFK
jgi:hypothetical protein